MRAETENRMNGIWYGEDPSPLWLRGLVPIYRVGQKLDRWWKLRHQPEDLNEACIIVVGNLSVGGSGKTPLVVRLCRLLREAGLQAGVISRGYGRSEQGLRLVSAGSDPRRAAGSPRPGTVNRTRSFRTGFGQATSRRGSTARAGAPVPVGPPRRT